MVNVIPRFERFYTATSPGAVGLASTDRHAASAQSRPARRTDYFASGADFPQSATHPNLLPGTLPGPLGHTRWQQRVTATAGHVVGLASTFAATGAAVAAFAAPMTGLGAGLAVGANILAAIVYFSSPAGSTKQTLGAYGIAGTFGALIGEITRHSGALACGVGAYTLGISLVLGSIGAMLPPETIQSMRAPVTAGVTGCCVAALVTLVVPASWSIAMAAHSVELYGGLVVFAAAMVQQTGEAVHEAENAEAFNPLHHAMGIYLSMLNIFLRLLEIAERNRREAA